MKKLLLFLLLLTSGWMISSCGEGGKKTESCQVFATVGFPEYTAACLKDAQGNILDTLQLNDGHISFVRTDTVNMPYIAIIRLINTTNTSDWAEMPIVVEQGKVNVEIGEYITTSGTQLNVRLQEFLNDLQATSDAYKVSECKKDNMKKTFSEFYRQQILSNSDNVVGIYIMQNYGFHLNEEDAALVKAQLGN